jgi:hypothetical protein
MERVVQDLTKEERAAWEEVDHRYLVMRKEWIAMYNYLDHKYPNSKNWTWTEGSKHE